jgi:hypothetical protein
MHAKYAFRLGPDAPSTGLPSPAAASRAGLVLLWLLAICYLTVLPPRRDRSPRRRERMHPHLPSPLLDPRWRAAALTLAAGSPVALLVVWLVGRRQ